MSVRDIVLDRGLPCDFESEKLILGCVILDNGLMAEVVEKLTPADFYNPSNRRILQVMLALEGEGKPIDPLTIQRRLEATGDLSDCGGPAYIASLFDGVPRFSTITNYVDRVEDCSVRRKQIAAGNQAMQLAYDFEQPAQVQLNAAQKALCDIQTRDGGAKWIQTGEAAYDALTTIEARMEDGKLITGIATGFADFDFMTAGLQKSDLIVIGGRPKMGKTAFAGSLLTNAAEDQDNWQNGAPPVIAFFSLEMSRAQIVHRMLCSLAKVDMQRARSGMVNKSDLKALSEAAERLDAMRIEIDDSSHQTPTMIRSKLRQLQQRRGALNLVVVDYLQIVSPDKRSDSMVREVSEVSRALKAIAKDFNVPVVALASLSRKPEERADKRPVPSDLRESGNIEFDADLIAFLYRDAVYNENANPNEAELIVRMQRNGPVGTVPLVFRGGISWFGSLAKGADYV